ncbi:uncharacterized protein [Spinacia oleracea]|uniref:Integrase catalytic domain-containing protein n=1 Tax=Spinacia oleracea TaxID=3562 RepID=A0ABM3QVC6_SPIOL|nr:uncharacterized protein LOC110794209 [Spinacia oleracea]
MMFGDSSNHHQSFQQNNDNGGTFDPYFVANSDNPTSSLVAVVFNGVNFMRWSRNVKRALIAKNKEVFINGEIQKPAVNHKDYLKWKRADFMVVSWILSSMNNDLADDFGYIDNAGELWKELNERFGQSNGPLIYQWDEMQSLRAFPTCVCGGMKSCSCLFLKKVSEFEEEDKMMKFLLGLNGGFEGTVTNVLSMDPLPSINRVFSITQQIQKQKEVNPAATESSAINSSAMAAQTHKGGQFQRFNNSQVKKDWRDLKKEKMNKVCSHCKGKGHTADQCFRLIGYPDWYNSIKASKGSQYGGGRLVAHVHSADMGDSPLDDTMIESGAVSSKMLNTICQEVMKVMKGKQTQNGESSGNACSYANYAGIISHSFNCNVNKLDDECLWIVDSGACDHMTYDADLLINKRKLHKVIKVGFPDGTQMSVNTIGDVVLSDKLILTDVLLVHGFRHNLLSVGRLIEQTGAHVVFTGDGYSFQDPCSFKLLGAGKRTEGLYYFVKETDCSTSQGGYSTRSNSIEINCNAVADVTADVVTDVNRIRLGHPSLSKMKHMNAEFCKGLAEYNCDVCLNAKQHKFPFSCNDNRASECFELIHVDLWGSYKVKSLDGASYFLNVLDDHSRITWTYLLHNKMQVAKVISEFLAKVETQFDKKKGIVHEKSAPYVPQQNGRVERKHRSLLEIARALRFHSGLPKKFWGECGLTATHLINKLPSKVLNWKTPSEIMFHSEPLFERLRVFGSLDRL